VSVAYILGNLLGRALVSYGLVWLVCWLSARLSWRVAFVRSRRWYSLLAVAVMTVLGVGGAIARAGGVH
jgi:hypothetical protein